MVEKYLTREQVIEYLAESHGITMRLSTLRQLGKKGPPYVRFGLRCAFLPRDVDAWLEQRKQQFTK